MTFKEGQEQAKNIPFEQAIRQRKKIYAYYDEALKDIDKQMSKIYAGFSTAKEEDLYNYMLKYDRLKKLRKQIFEIYKGSFS